MPGFGDDRAALVESRAGDVLLLTGETWSRHDFSVLRSVRQNGGVRIAVVCQDLIPVKFPQFFDGGDFPERFRRYADFLINDVDLVIAISEQTRNDILEYAGAHNGLLGDIRRSNSVTTWTIRHTETVRQRPTRTSESSSSVSARSSRARILACFISCGDVSPRRNSEICRSSSSSAAPALAAETCYGRSSMTQRFAIAWWSTLACRTQRYRGSIAIASSRFIRRFTRDGAYRLRKPRAREILYCLEHTGTRRGRPRTCQAYRPPDFAAWQSAIVELVGSPDLISQFERRIRERYRAVTWRQSAERLANMLRTPQRPHS